MYTATFKNNHSIITRCYIFLKLPATYPVASCRNNDILITQGGTTFLYCPNFKTNRHGEHDIPFVGAKLLI